MDIVKLFLFRFVIFYIFGSWFRFFLYCTSMTFMTIYHPFFLNTVLIAILLQKMLNFLLVYRWNLLHGWSNIEIEKVFSRIKVKILIVKAIKPFTVQKILSFYYRLFFGSDKGVYLFAYFFRIRFNLRFNILECGF